MPEPGDLHIISFNVPDPPDFGGVIEVWEKIRALHGLGVRVHLHCFLYNRPPSPALETYCASVHYYQRKTGLAGLLHQLPYIVASRNSREMRERLVQDDFPILVESLHGSGFLFKGLWADRVVLIRLHNLESVYYRNQAAWAGSLMRRIYFRMEARKLKRYENLLASTPRFFLAIHPGDRQAFSAQHPYSRVEYLPAFLPFGEVRSLEGKGDYWLYHGDLSVPDNAHAVRWIIEKVWEPGLGSLVIAGRSPARSLVRMIRPGSGIRLVADPTPESLEEWIRRAHGHLVVSFNSTGIKFKMLHALFRGRHCVVEEGLVRETGLEPLCRLVSGVTAYKSAILELNQVPFGPSDIQMRRNLLEKHFNNRENALRLLQYSSRT